MALGQDVMRLRAVLSGNEADAAAAFFDGWIVKTCACDCLDHTRLLQKKCQQS